MRKRIPGQRSNITLLVTGTWTILALFIVIVGHLVWAFFFYGLFTQTDALAELESAFPILTMPYLYILAALAVVGDIWIFISHKKQLEYKIKR